MTTRITRITRITRKKPDHNPSGACGTIDIGIFDIAVWPPKPEADRQRFSWVITASDSSGGRAILAKGGAPDMDGAKRKEKENALHAAGDIAHGILQALERELED